MPMQNLVYETFPLGAGFRMALQRVLDWEHTIARHVKTVANEKPVGVLLVNVYERRLVGRWRVGIGICGVDLDANVSFVRAQGNEHSHAGLLDA